MSHKRKCYEIFGLKENAGKNDIRKAYRKLAMQFHPDKNPDPKAHQLFIRLTEAYEFLLEDKPYQKQKTKKEKSFEQRKKEAEFRYRQQQEKQRLEQEYYFRKLTSGWKWNLFGFGSFLGFFLALILLAEPFLLRIFETHQIVARSENYNGLVNDQVVCVKTDKNLKLFIKNPYFSMFDSNPTITVERSLVFHNPIKVWYQTIHYRKSFEVDFSAVNLYPIIPVLFSIPLLVYRFKRKSYWFTFGFLGSRFLIFPCIIWFLLTQDRWIHLLTFGII